MGIAVVEQFAHAGEIAIEQNLHAAQRVIRGDAFVQADIAEHACLLGFKATHSIHRKLGRRFRPQFARTPAAGKGRRVSHQPVNAAFAGNGEARVNDLIDLGETIEVLPDQRQSSMRGQVVGQTFDLKVGHGGTGIFKAAIISSPAAFTRWVQQSSLQTRVSAMLGRKRSRIQDLFSAFHRTLCKIENLFLNYFEHRPF